MDFSDDFPMIAEVEAGQNPNYVPAVMVAFGMYPMRDGAKSVEAGHDVYVEVEHVKIAIPGDRNSLFFQPATDVYRNRFPKAYDAFKKRGTEAVVGLPVEQWAAVNRSIALTLKAANIPTVEALASVHDGNIDRIGISNARELQAKAKAFLAQAKDSAATAKLAADKQALEDRLRGMEAQMAEMTKRNGGAEVDAEARASRRPASRAHAG